MLFSYSLWRVFDFLKRESAHVAVAVAEPEPPQMSNEERLAAALANFQEADEEFSAASARFLEYIRSNPDTRFVFVNGRMEWRVGGGSGSDPQREKLEQDVTRARTRRNETLRVWSFLKVAAENQNKGG